MKKTCNRCRAYQSNGNCALGYLTEKIYYNEIGSPILGSKPKEECQKPITINELIQAKNIKNKRLNPPD